jgi:hypothetical protein
VCIQLRFAPPPPPSPPRTTAGLSRCAAVPLPIHRRQHLVTLSRPLAQDGVGLDHLRECDPLNPVLIPGFVATTPLLRSGYRAQWRKASQTSGQMIAAAALIACGYPPSDEEESGSGSSPWSDGSDGGGSATAAHHHSSSHTYVILLLCVAVGASGFPMAGFNVNHLDIAPKYAVRERYCCVYDLDLLRSPHVSIIHHVCLSCLSCLSMRAHLRRVC